VSHLMIADPIMTNTRRRLFHNPYDTGNDSEDLDADIYNVDFLVFGGASSFGTICSVQCRKPSPTFLGSDHHPSHFYDSRNPKGSRKKNPSRQYGEFTYRTHPSQTTDVSPPGDPPSRYSNLSNLALCSAHVACLVNYLPKWQCMQKCVECVENHVCIKAGDSPMASQVNAEGGGSMMARMWRQ
jgi:hypothetical protein